MTSGPNLAFDIGADDQRSEDRQICLVADQGRPATNPAAGLLTNPEAVSISTLVLGESPRTGGLDHDHVQRLVEAVDPLPPVLVHRASMRIIDGFHRIAAALRSGATKIDVLFLEGSVEAAFVIAVRANMAHGRPLSHADRRSAARRILRTHSQWSDRAIADATGLSAKTVQGIRVHGSDDAAPSHRVGRDGRSRPLDAAAGRQRAARIISERPMASLREIAAAAGISAGTVRDVRDRLRRGDDPVPTSVTVRGDRSARSGQLAEEPDDPARASVNPILAALSKDPALRMNAAGRELLRWLHGHAINPVDGSKIANAVPGHCIEHLVELANRCSANWAAIAADLDRSRSSRSANTQRSGGTSGV